MSTSITNQTSDSARDIADLYAQFQRPIITYLTHLVGERETAEDLYQETFMKAMRHWTALHDPACRTSWLYRIATNTAYDYIRRRKRISMLPLDTMLEAPDEHDPPDVHFSLAASVHVALAQIPAQYREALLLYVCAGHSTHEIAAALGCSELAIRLRVSRGRTRFKQLYSHEYAA